MHKEAKRTFLRRLISAGALLGALGLVGFDSVQAEDSPEGGRFFRRNRFGFASRKSEQRQSIYEIQQVQNQEPQFERADEKERPFEETDQQAPQQSNNAAEKETPPEEPPPAPWTLTNLFDDDSGNNTLKDWGVKISGHSQWGYSSGPDGAFTGNGPFLNQQEWSQFNLNQQYLYVEKVADGKKGLDWGFRGDVLYGVDGNEGQAFGNIDPGHWDYLNGFDHGSYEWAFPQLYGEVAYGDLSIKGGHFYTIVGYEVVPSTGQFFFSRQLTFWNSEPFTHTGALATYKASDKLTVSGGWVFGMDTGFYQYQGGNAFLGGFTYQIDEKTTFVYSVIAGNLGWRGDGAINSWILSRQWTKKFSTVHQFDVLATNLETADRQPVSFANPNS
ncbi:MAG TPA: outer membrane beta-barrel protein, partial [Planctomycetaceae bacterium]|nr:outer membrane beta-barrel protein [Planctomycetaceae bacterium]